MVASQKKLHNLNVVSFCRAIHKPFARWRLSDLTLTRAVGERKTNLTQGGLPGGWISAKCDGFFTW